jgi:ATP-dependent Lon protease
MSTFDAFPEMPAEFDGLVRLFPLPNLVLFPHVMQPLHIFEPRYRDLLEGALAGDRLITMALLVPGWENDYEGRPPLYPTACLGRVSTHYQLDDGAYNLLLLGVRRVKLIEELPPARSYREARVELCDDDLPTTQATSRAGLRKRLRQAFMQVVPMLPEAQEQLDQLLGADIPLGVLTDLISYMLDLDVADKYALLAELNVVRRAEMLLEHLASAACEESVTRAGIRFPPDFSAN